MPLYIIFLRVAKTLNLPRKFWFRYATGFLKLKKKKICNVV